MSPWAWVQAGIVEREAVLLAVRDLVVLILIIVIALWIARQLRRKDD